MRKRGTERWQRTSEVWAVHNIIQNYKRKDASTPRSNPCEGISTVSLTCPSGQVDEQSPEALGRHRLPVEVLWRTSGQRRKPDGTGETLLSAAEISALRLGRDCDSAVTDAHAAEAEGGGATSTCRSEGEASNLAGPCGLHDESCDSEPWVFLWEGSAGWQDRSQPAGGPGRRRAFSRSDSACAKRSPESQGGAQEEPLAGAASAHWRRRSWEGRRGRAETGAGEAGSLTAERQLWGAKLRELQLRLREEQRDRQLAEEGIKAAESAALRWAEERRRLQWEALLLKEQVLQLQSMAWHAAQEAERQARRRRAAEQSLQELRAGLAALLAGGGGEGAAQSLRVKAAGRSALGRCSDSEMGAEIEGEYRLLGGQEEEAPVALQPGDQRPFWHCYEAEPQLLGDPRQGGSSSSGQGTCSSRGNSRCRSYFGDTTESRDSSEDEACLSSAGASPCAGVEEEAGEVQAGAGNSCRIGVAGRWAQGEASTGEETVPDSPLGGSQGSSCNSNFESSCLAEKGGSCARPPEPEWGPRME